MQGLPKGVFCAAAAKHTQFFLQAVLIVPFFQLSILKVRLSIWSFFRPAQFEVVHNFTFNYSLELRAKPELSLRTPRG